MKTNILILICIGISSCSFLSQVEKASSLGLSLDKDTFRGIYDDCMNECKVFNEKPISDSFDCVAMWLADKAIEMVVLENFEAEDASLYEKLKKWAREAYEKYIEKNETQVVANEGNIIGVFISCLDECESSFYVGNYQFRECVESCFAKEWFNK